MISPKIFQWRGTEEHFIEAHNIFRERTQEVHHIVKSMSSLLPTPLKSILGMKPNDLEGINVLSIGSGQGQMDIEVLKIVNKQIQHQRSGHAIKLFNRAVEPQLNALNAYRNSINGGLPKELSNAKVAFDIDHPKTFQEYVVQNDGEKVEFDIVHFIHSIYHINDIEKALTHCYEKELGEHGMIVLILTGKEDPFERIKDVVFGISHLGSKIEEVARKNGWDQKVYSQDYPLEVTEVFDEESIEGNLLLDFFAHSKGFRFNANRGKVKLFLECLKELSTFQNGSLWTSVRADTHIIFK